MSYLNLSCLNNSDVLLKLHFFFLKMEIVSKTVKLHYAANTDINNAIGINSPP